MPKENSKPGIGSRRIPQLLNCTPKAINSTPTTSKQRNTPVIFQILPQEHLSWNHKVPPKDHFTHPKLTLINNTTTHSPHLDRHTVPHQYFIHTRYLDYKLPDTTKGCGIDGRIQMH